MNQLDQSQEAGEAPEAAHGRSDLQKELAEGLRQRAAISAVLRAIAGSPHDLQPIFDAILDNAIRLCRAESGTFRLVEEAGFRLVAHAAVSEGFSPPILREHGNFLLRLLAGKSPVHIPRLVKGKIRTHLLVPMLTNDELVGALTISRRRIE
jgi:GAF domain-containing protein